MLQQKICRHLSIACKKINKLSKPRFPNNINQRKIIIFFNNIVHIFKAPCQLNIIHQCVESKAAPISQKLLSSILR